MNDTEIGYKDLDYLQEDLARVKWQAVTSTNFRLPQKQRISLPGQGLLFSPGTAYTV
jgi:hypothetical protein